MKKSLLLKRLSYPRQQRTVVVPLREGETRGGRRDAKSCIPTTTLKFPNIKLASTPKSRYMVSFICLILSLLLCISLGSCGYSSKSLLRSNVRSIYIPIFDNTTFRRGFEFDLTKAVRDQILLRTHLTIIDKDEADSVLFGKITSVDENVLIEDRRDNIVESRVSIGIEIRWVDKRTGRTILERKNIRKPAEFIVRRNETLSSASNEAFVRVAQGIVEAMEEDW